MLKETANDIADLSSYLNKVSDKEITNSIIPNLSDNIKKNIEYFNQYIYDIKAYNFTIDDIDILDLLINKDRAYFALYPTLISVKLNDKEWSKYSVLCSKIQETTYHLIKQRNELIAKEDFQKNNNSKHKEVIHNLKEEEKKEQISINTAELKSYFKLAFINAKVGDKKKGDKYETSFEMLIDDLQKNRTMKDYARFALIIYDSNKLTNGMKPNTFEEWYTTFCRIVGCKHSKNYKRCKLEDRNLENHKRNLYYLQ